MRCNCPLLFCGPLLQLFSNPLTHILPQNKKQKAERGKRGRKLLPMLGNIRHLLLQNQSAPLFHPNQAKCAKFPHHIPPLVSSPFCLCTITVIHRNRKRININICILASMNECPFIPFIYWMPFSSMCAL